MANKLEHHSENINIDITLTKMHNGWERTDARLELTLSNCFRDVFRSVKTLILNNVRRRSQAKLIMVSYTSIEVFKTIHFIEPAERPIHVDDESNCQDRVYWKFCQSQCALHDVNARVAKFNCTEEVKKEAMKEILTLDQCDYEYHQVKWIDCYCKPNG